jgi:hypothetical protein
MNEKVRGKLMENVDIIEGLKLTKDLWEFNPVTGDKVEPHIMNELDRTTYDAVCGALERLTPKKVDSYAARLVDLPNGACKKVGGYKCPECNAYVEHGIRFCRDCGQALDWRTK